jgi:hypothetical protein
MGDRLVKFVAWAVRAAIHVCPWLSAVYRQHISTRSKCLWCGAVKRHRIQASFSPDSKLGVVIHTCAVCAGQWGVDPLTPAAKLFRQPTEDEAHSRDTGEVKP